MNITRLLLHGLLSILLLTASPLSAELGVVFTWDNFNNRPDYLLGAAVTNQADRGDGELFGILFNFAGDKGATAKQATRQSLTGTFGDSTNLFTFEGVPVFPDTATSALRINVDQVLRMTFKNVSQTEVTLGRFYFDYGRSNNNSPITINTFYTGPNGTETLVLSDGNTPVTGLIAEYVGFSIDLSSHLILPGDAFTLTFTATDGSSGGNLDNMALTISSISDPDLCRFVSAGGWIDTRGWFGSLWETDTPWYYSLEMGGWIYVHEQLPAPCSDRGGWVFLQR